jgi:hypothetical protein
MISCTSPERYLFTAEPARNTALRLGSAVLNLAVELVDLLCCVGLDVLSPGFGLRLGLRDLLVDASDLLSRRSLLDCLCQEKNLIPNVYVAATLSTAPVRLIKTKTYSVVILGAHLRAEFLALGLHLLNARGNLALYLSGRLVNIA